MIGPHEKDSLKRTRAFRPGRDVPSGPECLDEDFIAALAEGSLGSDDVAEGLAHLATCDDCRAAVASVARALADPQVAREIQAIDSPRRMRISRRGWVTVAAAAAAAVLLLALPIELERDPNPHRSSPITAAAAPEALWPVGEVEAARSLRWTPVSGADRYRVSLFDADGSVRFEAEQEATRLVLPDTVVIAPGQTYWWRVDARVGFDRWTSSTLVEFSIAPDAPR